MTELAFTITNLNCDACVKVSTKALHTLPGVIDVSVELSTGATRITSQEPLNPRDVAELLKTKGYIATF